MISWRRLCQAVACSVVAVGLIVLLVPNRFTEPGAGEPAASRLVESGIGSGSEFASSSFEDSIVRTETTSVELSRPLRFQVRVVEAPELGGNEARVIAGTIESASGDTGEGRVAWATGTSVFSDSLAVSELEQGLFEFQGATGALHAVGIFYPHAYFSGLAYSPGETEKSVTVRGAPPITLTVIGVDGAPIEGASVTVRSELNEPWQVSDTVEARLLRLYRVDLSTDANGSVTVLTPLDGEMVAFVRLRDGSTGGIAWGLQAGDRKEIQVAQSATVQVFLHDESGAPIPEADVSVFVGGLDGESIVDSRQTDSAGVATVSANADGRAVVIHAHHSDKTPEVLQLFGIQSGEVRVVSLLLTSCFAREIRLVDSVGRALSGVQPSLRYRTGAWGMQVYSTGDDGVISPRPRIPSGQQVSVDIWSDGLLAGRLAPIFSDSTDGVELAVSGVGRLGSVGRASGVDQEIVKLELVGDRGPGDGISEWRLGEPSPWLPSGMASVVVYWGDGLVSEMRVPVLEGQDEVVIVSRASSELTLLDHSGQFQEWDFQLLSPSGAVAAEGSVGTDGQQLLVSQGRHVLRLYLPDSADFFDSPMFNIDRSAFDLDLAGLFGSGSVSGIVVDANGAPMTGVGIGITRADQWVVGWSVTDESGAFRISGLLPGMYRATVYWDTVGAVEGETTEAFSIRPDSRNSVLSFRAALSLGARVIQAEAISEGKPVGFSVTHSQVATFFVDAEGRMMIAEGAAGQHVGFLEGTAKTLTAAISPLTVQDPQVVSLSGIATTNIRVVDESGRPAKDIGIGLAIQGTALPFLGTRTGPDGLVAVQVRSPVPVDVVVRTPREGTFTIPFEAVRQSGTISIPAPTTRLQIVDLRGNPISFATVSGRRSDFSATSNRLGEVLLAGAGHGDYLVSKPGFWPTIAHRTDTIAVLRTDCSRVEFQFRLDEESTIKIAPAFEIGYELHLQPERIGSAADAWRLPSLPEGRYTLTVLDEAGTPGKQSALYIEP